MKACMKELLLDCGITAGIWLDLIMAYYPLMLKGMLDIDEIYTYLRSLRPELLISWKQGANGTEDFAAPEQHFHSLEDTIRKNYGDKAAAISSSAWGINKMKHNEICATIQENSWGFNAFNPHRSVEDCYNLLGHASMHNANLLLNIGPMGDGSVHPEQIRILRELGKQIRRDGWPSTGNINGEK